MVAPPYSIRLLGESCSRVFPAVVIQRSLQVVETSTTGHATQTEGIGRGGIGGFITLKSFTSKVKMGRGGEGRAEMGGGARRLAKVEHIVLKTSDFGMVSSARIARFMSSRSSFVGRRESKLIGRKEEVVTVQVTPGGGEASKVTPKREPA